MKIFDETDSRFYLDQSTISGAGTGLFSAHELPAGEMIRALGCYLIPDSQLDQCTAYADEYKLRVDDLLLIPVGPAAMVNHSDSPNLEKVIVDRCLYFRTLRDIRKNEELFIRYSDYALTRFVHRSHPPSVSG